METETPEQAAANKLAADKKNKELMALSTFHGIRPGKLCYTTPQLFKNHKPPSEWPVFKYATATGTAMAEAIRVFFPENFIVTERACGKEGKEFAQKYLKGWENFKDEDGEDVPFIPDANGTMTDDTWECLIPSLRIEIVTDIVFNNHLTKEEITGLKS